MKIIYFLETIATLGLEVGKSFQLNVLMKSNESKVKVVQWPWSKVT